MPNRPTPPDPAYATLSPTERKARQERIRQQQERGEISKAEAQAALAQLAPPNVLKG